MTPLQHKLHNLTRRYEYFREMYDLARKTGNDPSAYKKNMVITADEYMKLEMIRITAGREHETK